MINNVEKKAEWGIVNDGVEMGLEFTIESQGGFTAQHPAG